MSMAEDLRGKPSGEVLPQADDLLGELMGHKPEPIARPGREALANDLLASEHVEEAAFGRELVAIHGNEGVHKRFSAGFLPRAKIDLGGILGESAELGRVLGRR